MFFKVMPGKRERRKEVKLLCGHNPPDYGVLIGLAFLRALHL
jgi:hypothetical protein